MTFNTLINAATLATNLNRNNWIVFDCRFQLATPTAGEQAYRCGHIPGARYAHLDKDLSSPVRDYTGRHPLPQFNEFASRLAHWGVSNNSQIVIYDDAGGAIASRLWWLLRSLGHEKAAVLDGGWQQWLHSGFPCTTALSAYQPRLYRAYPNPEMQRSASQIENDLARNRIKLVDARASVRFTGLQEPIDPIAGHIPKALNRPFQLNLDEHGCFLSATALRQAFSELIGDFPSDQVVHMCGSGVTACHNLLAMEIAGLPGSKLYPGSWSEWIRDPNRSRSA